MHQTVTLTLFTCGYVAAAVMGGLQELFLLDSVPTPHNCKIVFSEVLCYAHNYLQNSMNENLKTLIVTSFQEEEILEAKRKLWRVAGEHLPAWADRRKTTKRTVADANAFDTIEALREIDKLECYVFAATKLQNLPTNAPEALHPGSLLCRIEDLEKKFKDAEEIHSINQANVLKLSDTVTRVDGIAMANKRLLDDLQQTVSSPLEQDGSEGEQSDEEGESESESDNDDAESVHSTDDTHEDPGDGVAEDETEIETQEIETQVKTLADVITGQSNGAAQTGSKIPTVTAAGSGDSGGETSRNNRSGSLVGGLSGSSKPRRNIRAADGDSRVRETGRKSGGSSRLRAALPASGGKLDFGQRGRQSRGSLGVSHRGGDQVRGTLRTGGLRGGLANKHSRGNHSHFRMEKNKLSLWNEDSDGFRFPGKFVRKQQRLHNNDNKDIKIFIGNVDKQFHVEDIFDHVSELKVNVRGLYQRSHPLARQRAYVCIVSIKDSRTLLRKDNWPAGIEVRKYD